METSRIMARIIGPILIVPALGVLLNLEAYRHLIEEFSRSPALCYLGGFMALLLGLTVLQFHHKWEFRWPVVITILGWISVVKGVVLTLLPGLIPNLWYPYAAAPAPMIVSLAISFVVGVFLTIKGYWG
jgi:hypothetical protein